MALVRGCEATGAPPTEFSIRPLSANPHAPAVACTVRRSPFAGAWMLGLWLLGALLAVRMAAHLSDAAAGSDWRMAVVALALIGCGVFAAEAWRRAPQGDLALGRAGLVVAAGGRLRALRCAAASARSANAAAGALVRLGRWAHVVVLAARPCGRQRVVLACAAVRVVGAPTPNAGCLARWSRICGRLGWHTGVTPSPPPPPSDLPVESAPADTDLMLVERTVAGDQRAFELLVIKYQRRIQRLIGRMVRDVDLVEDIAQETFIRAYRALASVPRRCAVLHLALPDRGEHRQEGVG